MGWRLVGVILLCILTFIAGLMVGGIDSSWMNSGHSSEVAFWSMLGGWVSGIATVAAVIVSLFMAYLASQANVEKIKMIFTPKGHNQFGDYVFKNSLTIKNLSAVNTPIMKFFIQIDGAYADLYPTQMGIFQLPYTLQQQGESWVYETHLVPSAGWVSVFSSLAQQKIIKFKSGYFIVETALKQHRLKIPKEMLSDIKELKEKIDRIS
ncbi:hypothetical protein ACOTXN_04665 [Enterobacter cloacae complex sp. IR53043]|uniref:hypothetical protein n=1 Tax=Enterobacter cloacae complex TaxID=354276 RepID=UPI001868BA06|nr:hypothetical protein [Enterobacter hormaechei]MBN9872203.1 hypothetical protein [Enterobacter hormaechei]